MDKHQTFLIIGPNGIGKSTILPILKSELDSTVFDIHDFDERGVPDNADKNWRVSETQYWMNLGITNQVNKSTIICGFMKPEEISSIADQLKEKPVTILLDGTSETIEERLLHRYQTPESILELKRATGKTVQKFIADNVYYSSMLRDKCKEASCIIVDTDKLTPAEVAEKIIGFISSAN